MKRKYLIAGSLIALMSGACTQTQQTQQTQLQPSAQAPAAVTGENAEDTQNKTDENTDEAQQQPGKVHVCSGLLSCKLGLCPNGRRRKAALAAGKTIEEIIAEEKKTAQQTQAAEASEDEAPIAPSAEQMAAAQKLMQEQQQQSEPRRRASSASTSSSSRHEVPVAERVEHYPVVTAETTSGIPGRGGLRRGHFAPPEEAASRADNDSPLPNAAERHGLRSPSLPSSLPMNIDGRTH